MDMPGLSKEDVKLTVEENTLIVKGKGKKEFGGKDGIGRSYSGKIDLPEKLYRIKAITAEMKNGVLKAFVPKIQDEERTDVFKVSIN
ncbi:heat shock 22 kDa protein mitochondrial [Phtheirospermum japonicum]|uniref:Heat shock 22 kDa protein mitochondrial n=1 Tax=Phtheirospermum japonicum TaxID=374723 RepID=A0A830BQB8_9LAMI|nr:heat shock 22 kDa protein mitochondrial [Phtheirospermum japonicum]